MARPASPPAIRATARRLFGRLPLVLDQPVAQLRLRHRPDPQRLGARADGRQQPARLVGDQHEHLAWQRLLERLEQRVLRLLVGPVGALDQDHALVRRRSATRRWPAASGARRPRCSRRWHAPRATDRDRPPPGRDGCAPARRGSRGRRCMAGGPGSSAWQKRRASRSSAKAPLPAPAGPCTSSVRCRRPDCAARSAAARACGCPRLWNPAVGAAIVIGPEYRRQLGEAR